MAVLLYILRDKQNLFNKHNNIIIMTINIPTSNDLSPVQIQTVISRLPTFELSYETIAHKKVYPSYNIGIAIPNGKKHYAYFSFHENTNVCYLMEIRENKHDTYSKKISKITIMDNNVSQDLCIGTLLYGTLVSMDETETTLDKSKSFFVIEDIIQYKGFVLGNIPFSNKLGYIDDMFQYHMHISPSISTIFVLPYIWEVHDHNEPAIIADYEKEKCNLFYNTHHIQLRKWDEISPHLNITLNKLGSGTTGSTGTTGTSANINIGTDIGTLVNVPRKTPIPSMPSISMQPIIMDYKKPQYKYPCIFNVCADIQYDVYHLYACGKNNSLIYYNLAGIPTLKTSVFMNSLFRNIKENQNIDFIEESDDESEFENVAEDKYVDLNKNLLIECVFHFKFKKWVPVRLAPEGSRIIHVSKL